MIIGLVILPLISTASFYEEDAAQASRDHLVTLLAIASDNDEKSSPKQDEIIVPAELKLEFQRLETDALDGLWSKYCPGPVGRGTRTVFKAAPCLGRKAKVVFSFNPLRLLPFVTICAADFILEEFILTDLRSGVVSGIEMVLSLDRELRGELSGINRASLDPRLLRQRVESLKARFVDKLEKLEHHLEDVLSPVQRFAVTAYPEQQTDEQIEKKFKPSAQPASAVVVSVTTAEQSIDVPNPRQPVPAPPKPQERHSTSAFKLVLGVPALEELKKRVHESRLVPPLSLEEWSFRRNVWIKALKYVAMRCQARLQMVWFRRMWSVGKCLTSRCRRVERNEESKDNIAQ